MFDFKGSAKTIGSRSDFQNKILFDFFIFFQLKSHSNIEFSDTENGRVAAK